MERHVLLAEKKIFTETRAGVLMNTIFTKTRTVLTKTGTGVFLMETRARMNRFPILKHSITDSLCVSISLLYGDEGGLDGDGDEDE